MAGFSLWQGYRQSDEYKFIDRIVGESFRIGGFPAIVHMYLGLDEESLKTGDKTQPNWLAQNLNTPETAIQDFLFVENRDRKYSKDLIELRAVYSVQDNEFEMNQFVAQLAGDIITLEFHINDMAMQLGRKMMAGDVIEFPHLRDDLLLDEDAPAINRYYVVQEVTRASNGYSPTWLPHIFRVKLTAMNDAQEFRDILETRAGDLDQELKDLISNFNNVFNASTAVTEQAEEEVDRRHFDESHLFFKDGTAYVWQQNADGTPPNGLPFESGTRFPQSPSEDDYFLRTDYKPIRLFQRKGNRWIAVEENMRPEWKPGTETIADFVNNDQQIQVGPNVEDIQPSKQPLSKVVKPKAN